MHYEVVGIRETETFALGYKGTHERPALFEALRTALDTTVSWLHFTTGKVGSVEGLKKGSAANCIGYARFFSSALQLELGNTSTQYTIQPVIAQLHIGIYNLHDLFSNPFWKDHDIVRIHNHATGELVFIDPTLYDDVGSVAVRGPVRVN